MNYNHIQVIKFGQFKTVKIVFEEFTYSFMVKHNSVMPGTYKKIRE